MKEGPNQNEIKYSVLKEHAEGEPSKKRREQIGSWFENPDDRFKFEHCLKELWKETDPDNVSSPTGLDVILDRIHHKINLLQPKKVSLYKRGQNIPVIKLDTFLKSLTRVAAILMLPIMAFLGWDLQTKANRCYNEKCQLIGKYEKSIKTSGQICLSLN